MNKFFILIIILFILSNLFSFDSIDLSKGWQFGFTKIQDKSPVEFPELKLPRYPNQTIKIDTPHSWKQYNLPKEQCYGVYTKGFVIPENIKGLNLGVRLGIIDEVDKTYINGHFIGKTGNFYPRKHAWDTQRLYYIPYRFLKEHGTNIIKIEVGNIGFSSGGLKRGVYKIGRFTNLINSEQKSQFFKIIFIAISGLIGLYYLFFFLRQRQLKENLYFGLFSLTLALFNLCQLNNTLLLFKPFIFYKRIEYGLLFLLPIFIILFFYFFYNLGEYGIKNFKIFKIVVVFFAVLSVVSVFAVIISPKYGTWRMIKKNLFFPSLIFSAVLLIITTFYKSIFQKNIDARITILGLFVFMLTAINDILVNYEVYQGNRNLLPYGFLLFVLTLAVILVNRFVRLHHEVEDLNLNLENKVKQRTEELKKAMDELSEKDKRIEIELRMAGEIQKSFLPMEIPVWKNIKTIVYYKPKGSVANNFYDHLTFKLKKIGLVFAEVYRHGVPAALISTLAHRAFIKAIEETENTVAILKFAETELNRSLKSEVFLNCFVMTIDDKNNLVCSNASNHKPVYYDSQNRIIKFIDTAGKPIHIPSSDNEFNEKKFKFNDRDKLIIYSKGILNAVNSNNEKYGKHRLLEAIKKYHNEEIESFTKKIIDDFNNYIDTGQLKFDITLIAIGS